MSLSFLSPSTLAIFILFFSMIGSQELDTDLWGTFEFNTYGTFGVMFLDLGFCNTVFRSHMLGNHQLFLRYSLF